MPNKRIIFLSCCFFTLFSACYYHKADIVYPASNNTCDTVNITYSGEITNILTTFCSECHNGASATSGINLFDYNKIKQYVDNGALLHAVNRDGLVQPMPQTPLPKLSDCNIAKITAWVQNGAPKE